MLFSLLFIAKGPSIIAMNTVRQSVKHENMPEYMKEIICLSVSQSVSVSIQRNQKFVSQSVSQYQTKTVVFSHLLSTCQYVSIFN